MLCYGGHFTLTKHELSQLLHLATTDAVITSRKIANDHHQTLVKTLVVTVCTVCLGDIFITDREVCEVDHTRCFWVHVFDQEPWYLEKDSIHHT